MSLSLTPISEAWLPPKPRKYKRNEFSESNKQVEILKNSNLQVTNSAPSGNDTRYVGFAHASDPSSSPEAPPVESTSQPKTRKETLSVDISDDTILDKLQPFKQEYVTYIVHSALYKHFAIDPEPEAKNIDNNLKTIIALVALLFVIDILMKMN